MDSSTSTTLLAQYEKRLSDLNDLTTEFLDLGRTIDTVESICPINPGMDNKCL